MSEMDDLAAFAVLIDAGSFTLAAAELRVTQAAVSQQIKTLEREMNTALFLGISLIKYKIEFIFLFPLVALLFSWYFSISMNADSVVQTPEKLFHEKKFMLYTALLVVLVFLLVQYQRWRVAHARDRADLANR